MPKKKKVENIAMVGIVVQIIFLAITFALFSQSGRSPALLTEVWFLVPGLLVWLVVLLHGRQRRLARAEQEEMQELRDKRVSEEIFEEQQLDQMRAHTGLRIFERYVVPAVGVILSLGLGFLCYLNLQTVLQTASVGPASNPLAVLAGMAIVTFFGFLFGKYAVGLAQNEEWRLLRAGGSYLMGNVAGSFILLVAMSLVHFGVLWAEVLAAYIIPIMMGLVAVEIALNLVLEIYRPRVPGQESRPAYDSRLLNLLSEPGDILETVASTLDYQFGFKISDTWFYRFMERAIVPIILIQVTLLWLLSGIVVVKQDEGVFMERFGRPIVTEADQERGLKATLFGPGYHLKLPWPIDQAHRLPVDWVVNREIGKIPVRAGEEYFPEQEDVPTMTDENIILWNEMHVEDPQRMTEANFLVPSSVEVGEDFGAPALNIARLIGFVHFRINRLENGDVDPRAAYRFFYNYQSPLRLVEDIAYRTMTRIAASQNFLRWIHKDRGKVSKEFARQLQEALNAREMGIEIIFAGMPAVHPPPETADAYGGVINAYEKKETMISEARMEAVEMEEKARGEAAEKVSSANSYGYRLKKVSEAERDRFGVQMDAFLKAPRVYRYRKYFSNVERVLDSHRLILVPETEKEVDIINMGEKSGSDIMDINMEESLQ